MQQAARHTAIARNPFDLSRESQGAANRAKQFLGGGNAGAGASTGKTELEKQNEAANALAAGYLRTKMLLGQVGEEAKVRYDLEFGKLSIVDNKLKANLITRARELDAANAANKAFEDARQAQIAGIQNQTEQAVIAAENAVQFGLAERARADAAAELIKRENDAIDDRSARLILSLRTDDEQKQASYDADINILRDSWARKLIDENQYLAARAALQKKYADKSLAQRYQEDRQAALNTKIFHNSTLADAGTFAGMMGELMQTKSRKLFEIGKAGAIGETIINTYASAQAAFASLARIPFAGVALGTAAAAAAIAVGFARVAAIKSTQFGGGGGAVGTFSASPSTGLPEIPNSSGFEQVAPASVAQALPPQRKDIFIHFEGEGMFSAAQIRDSLIPAINEALGDGVNLHVN